MSFKRIVAFIRNDKLQCLELEFRKHGVQGVWTNEIKGYGKYVNYFGKDGHIGHTKVEIYTSEEKVEEVVSVLMECTNSGDKDNGIITMEPVDTIFQIWTKAQIPADSM